MPGLPEDYLEWHPRHPEISCLVAFSNLGLGCRVKGLGSREQVSGFSGSGFRAVGSFIYVSISVLTWGPTGYMKRTSGACWVLLRNSTLSCLGFMCCAVVVVFFRPRDSSARLQHLREARTHYCKPFP